MVPGIHAILFALFDSKERLDREAMRRQVDISLACGVHGIGALGLATEVSKLSIGEREQVMAWTSEDVAGRAPLYFTIYGNSVEEQISQVRTAERCKADWIILQPPAVGTFAGMEYIRFFGRVADATSLPVAIQNAPAYMGRGLTAPEFRDLVTQHPNVRLLKGEGPVVEIKGVIDITEGRVPVFNGRGGLELVDNFRCGCAGLILAPDTIDYSVGAYRHFMAGNETKAEATYEQVLPTMVFIMQSVESLICYGKRIFGARAGIEIHDRSPALRPTDFGLALVAQHAKRLGPLPAARS